MNNTNTIVLAPVRQHPELAGADDSTVALFCDTLGIDLIRNWDGTPATTIAGAWRIREHLDAEHQRRAEIDAARRAEQAAADETDPVRLRAEAAAHRAAQPVAELPLPVPFASERFRDWDAEATERGEARFEKITPPAEPDYRTPLERLAAKRGE